MVWVNAVRVNQQGDVVKVNQFCPKGECGVCESAR